MKARRYPRVSWATLNRLFTVCRILNFEVGSKKDFYSFLLEDVLQRSDVF